VAGWHRRRPVFDDELFVLLPVVNAGRVGGDVRFAFLIRRDDRPGLTGLDDDVVRGIAVAASDRLFLVVGVSDGVLVVDEIAATREDAGLVDFHEVADAGNVPFDAAVAKAVAFGVANAGDKNVLGADLIDVGTGVFERKFGGFGIEIGVGAGERRFGVRADDVSRREQCTGSGTGSG